MLPSLLARHGRVVVKSITTSYTAAPPLPSPSVLRTYSSFNNLRMTHVRRRATPLALDHEDPNGEGEVATVAVNTLDDVDPNAALAAHFDLTTAIIDRNPGTAHHPLRVGHSYARAPDWDLTTDVRGMDARNNTFVENEDKYDYLNEVVWPKECVDEKGVAKKGEIFYHCEDIKYSPAKMWTVCEFTRGRSVDDAIVQLGRVLTKGSQLMIECLQAAKKMAAEHDIEYPSNTWVAEAAVFQSRMVKGGRRRKGSGVNPIHYRYCSLYIRLEEGTPPPPGRQGRVNDESGWSKMAAYLQQMRDRKIRLGL